MGVYIIVTMSMVALRFEKLIKALQGFLPVEATVLDAKCGIE